MNFKDYQAQGLLKIVQPNFKQIERQILRAEKDLKTFILVIENDPEWACSIAFQAMVRMGRALIYAHGYLPTEKKQHKTVVELTEKILGANFHFLVKQFDRLRKKRNVFFYEAEDTRNFAEAKQALQTAKELLGEIKSKIKNLNPQQTFKF